MMKHSDQLQQPWTLRLRSRAKRYHFYFKYSTNSRLSIRFQLPPFTLEFESKCKRSGNNGIVKSWLQRKNYWFGRRRRRRRRRKSDILWVVLLAVVVIVIMLQLLRSYIHSKFFWNFFWMTFNYDTPSGFLHQFFKEILDGLSRSLGL